MHRARVATARSACVFAAVAALVGGCLELGDIECAGGWVCPPDTICYVPTQSCAPRAVGQVCRGKADGVDCWFPGAGPGYQCAGELCVPTADDAAVCGNGVLERAEQCEDGNAQDGNGCSAGCRHEVCKDGVVTGLETCDGSELGGVGCDSLGFAVGSVGCGSNCRVVQTGCSTCGDGACETAEGGILPGQRPTVTLQLIPDAHAVTTRRRCLRRASFRSCSPAASV
ncbi:MAG: hypothetical protein ABI333_00440 [bacterium]